MQQGIPVAALTAELMTPTTGPSQLRVKHGLSGCQGILEKRGDLAGMADGEGVHGTSHRHVQHVPVDGRMVLAPVAEGTMTSSNSKPFARYAGATRVPPLKTLLSASIRRTSTSPCR